MLLIDLRLLPDQHSKARGPSAINASFFTSNARTLAMLRASGQASANVLPEKANLGKANLLHEMGLGQILATGPRDYSHRFLMTAAAAFGKFHKISPFKQTIRNLQRFRIDYDHPKSGILANGYNIDGVIFHYLHKNETLRQAWIVEKFNRLSEGESVTEKNPDQDTVVLMIALKYGAQEMPDTVIESRAILPNGAVPTTNVLTPSKFVVEDSVANPGRAFDAGARASDPR